MLKIRTFVFILLYIAAFIWAEYLCVHTYPTQRTAWLRYIAAIAPLVLLSLARRKSLKG